MAHHHHPFWQHQSSSHQPFLPSPGPSGSNHPFFPVNFNLGLNESSSTTGVGEVGHHLVTGAYGNGVLDSHGMEGIPHPWQGTENEGQGVPVEILRGFCSKHLDGGERNMESRKDMDLKDKCRLYGELEDIYGLAKMGELETNRAGSLSDITGENSSANAEILVQPAETRRIRAEHGSDNSVRGEARLARKRKRKLKETLSSMAEFFENFAKRVIDQQDALYRKFLEVVERIDAEKKEAESKWRRQEAAKRGKEAITRAHEEALAISREDQIVSYIEKLTGQSISLPPRRITTQPRGYEIEDEPIKTESTFVNSRSQSRWPKAEVEALIRATSSIETRVQEPGLKGSVWEEVGTLMGSMGYQRSARRCKEKWDNINKYFKKVKESTSKKRSHQSITCSYFDLLNQLYSTTLATSPCSSANVGSDALRSCRDMCTEIRRLSHLLHEENAGSVTTSRMTASAMISSKVGM